MKDYLRLPRQRDTNRSPLQLEPTRNHIMIADGNAIFEIVSYGSMTFLSTEEQAEGHRALTGFDWATRPLDSLAKVNDAWEPKTNSTTSPQSHHRMRSYG